MDKLTEEQIKEFWEWCGFAFTNDYWRHPKGWYFDSVDAGGFVRDRTFYSRTPPHLDLNNLFKYAVPNKAVKTVCLCNHFDYSEGIPKRNGYEATVMWDRMDNTTQGIDKDPALALFWALWQALKKDLGLC